MRPAAVAAFTEVATTVHANPSGAHRLARDARRLVDDAREHIAALVGADFAEIVFTSGGTEADNLAVFGSHDRSGGTLVASSVEHHAVLDAVVARGGRIVGVDAQGRIDLDQLADALDPSVRLVSVMLVNNEVGTLTPLDAVAAVVREAAPAAALHTDAVQAVPWLDVGTAAADADLVSLSAHKFGGPKGAGALVVRGRAAIAPRAVGGGQERERRSGTPNVAGIVAMGAAARTLAAERDAVAARVRALRDRLVDGLLAEIPDAVETGGSDAEARAGRVPGVAHLCLAGVDSESLLFLLEAREVYASAASSCASGALEPSHVLQAMGVDPGLAGGSLRLSLGWSTTPAEIDHALSAIPPAVAQLRRFT